MPITVHLTRTLRPNALCTSSSNEDERDKGLSHYEQHETRMVKRNKEQTVPNLEFVDHTPHT